MIDLHVHTTASDGQYSPTEIIQKAAESNINIIAITDHDTTSGLKKAEKACKKHKITFIPGIELNIERPSCEFHLLGLGLQKKSNELESIIKNLQKNRMERNALIIKKLNEQGISITLEEVQKYFPGEVLGRPHIARYLAEKKVVKKTQVAFDKYLGRGRSCFVEKTGADLDEAINAIYSSGGIPVIAHPLSLYLSWGKLEKTLKEFFERGIKGLEAFHPGAKYNECLRLEEIARKIGFFVTAGSDFHGENIRADRKLGHTADNRKIDEKYYFEELLPFLQKQSKN